MIKKLMIVPWFGSFPPWMDRWIANIEVLKSSGYDFLLTTNLDLFNDRCERLLGFRTPIVPGGGKLHDYRPLLGFLFQEELKGYDFWGHTDFDCVYGDVAKFLPDSKLAELDVYADGPYICGPWTLYRNDPFKVNDLYTQVSDWVAQVQDPSTSGWAEGVFSRALEHMRDAGKLRLEFGSLHRYEAEDFSKLVVGRRTLFLGNDEIFMYHFRRTKRYPGAFRGTPG